MYTKFNLAEHLVTKAEYTLLPACDQGYVIYAQAERIGSELRNLQTNPYVADSLNWKAWNNGQFIAMLDAQDAEG